MTTMLFLRVLCLLCLNVNIINTVSYTHLWRTSSVKITSNGLPGRAWFDRRLLVLKPTAISFLRASSFTTDAVINVFDIFEAEFEKYSYPPDRIFNVVETDISQLYKVRHQVYLV